MVVESKGDSTVGLSEKIRGLEGGPELLGWECLEEVLFAPECSWAGRPGGQGHIQKLQLVPLLWFLPS